MWNILWKLRLLLLPAWGGGARIINLCDVAGRVTINTSSIRCLYNPNEIYIYATYKLFHASNLSVLTEELV